MVVKKIYHFYAAHRNKKAGIKCGRIHGHTYDVVVYLKPKSLPVPDKTSSGVTILFSEIDSQVEPIIKEYDHTFIIFSQDPFIFYLDRANERYTEVPFETSAENMAIWIFNRIKNETDIPIIRIELSETKSSTVIYEPISK